MEIIKKLKITNRYKYIILAGILILVSIPYLVKLTHANLWYDEAIEYFYSKAVLGQVPGGGSTANMYERICSTYQPPLYNILMHFWLMLFDSEFGFRLCGVIVTAVGGVGIFFGIEELSDDDLWALMSTLLYMFTSSVAYYALECAEYNLMLCCMAWAVCFYIKTLKRSHVSSLIGFFIFACLAVYSQYGAVFLVIGMFCSIVVDAIINKNGAMVRNIAIGTIVVFIFAALPLIYFFLFPQMNKQGSVRVSHVPVFVDNIAIDFIKGIITCLYWDFTFPDLSILTDRLIIAGVGGALIFTVFALVKEHRQFYPFILSISVAYTIYFAAVACSFYGYNEWNGELGCNNLGGKYAIFLVPIIVVTLVESMRFTLNRLREEKSIIYKMSVPLFIVWIIIYCGIEIVKLGRVNWEKGDIREMTESWYESEAFDSLTLVHEQRDAMFQFYLIHNNQYSELYQNHIIATERWIRDAEYEDVKENLEIMGIYDYDDFYYITPMSGSYEAFTKVMEDKGYSIEIIFEGTSGLLHITKL